MSQAQKLIAEANAILKGAGYATDGRPKSDPRHSVKMLFTPVGGRVGRIHGKHR